MAYGKIKTDTLTYDNSGSDVDISVSTLATTATTAPLASPTFTGTPAAPTAGSGTSTTQIATTAFVAAAVPDVSGKANLASPTFTGTPAAPTAGSGTNTTQIATTAFVTAAVPNISSKANLASPTFTGTPAAPTAGSGTNTTQLATTAFVTAAVAGGGGGGGGKLALVSSTTISSAVASVTVTGITGYNQYKLFFDLPVSNAGIVYIRFGSGGTMDTGSNYFDNNTSSVTSSSSDKIHLIAGNSFDRFLSGEALITDLNTTEMTIYQYAGCKTQQHRQNVTSANSLGVHKPQTAQDSFQIFGSNSTIPSGGKLLVYGLAT